jgi:hypothetical protein
MARPSKLTYYDTKHSDTINYLNFLVHSNPYTSGYKRVGYRPHVYDSFPSSSYFRPSNAAHFDLSALRLNPDMPRQFYASQFHPHWIPQNLEYFSQFHTSRLYPHFRTNNLIRQFNHLYSSIRKLYNNFNNIHNGPVTVLVRSKEDPTKLVAIFVEQGLQTLGKCSSLYVKK